MNQLFQMLWTSIAGGKKVICAVAPGSIEDLASVKELIEKKFVEAVPEGRSKNLTTTPLFADYFGLDSDRIKMKAQLKFKMKKILEEQREAEEAVASE